MLRSLGIRAKVLAVLAVPVIAVAVISLIVVLIIGAPPGMIALLVGVGIVGIVAHFVVGSIVAKSITQPLVELAAAADEVAESLPDIVERVSANEEVEFSELPVETDDEVGRLTSSINDLSTTTINFARERAAFAKDQADVRGSIANMFVNVARRDQTLLKRVLSQVTEMERTEEDPDTLDKLFKLDHLATRMRRNAESLLVLAGRESSRRRRQPMPLTDVARSASSEIEHYERVDLHQYIDPAMLGHAALPTSHLLAELLENATRYSEPGSRVTVEAKEGPRGVRITIADTGLGMSEAELETFNDRIANPPTDDVIGTEKMGFYVVGRLADKLDASVVLSKAEPKGTVATIDLGAALFVPGAVTTTEEPAEDFGLGEGDWDAVETSDVPPSQGTKTGHLTTGISPAAAALAAAAASQDDGELTPEIKAAPSRPGSLPSRGGALPSRGSLPSRGARAEAKPAEDKPAAKPAEAAGADEAGGGPAMPPSSHFGGGAATDTVVKEPATETEADAPAVDPASAVPAPRHESSAPSRPSALARRGSSEKREASSELSSLARRQPAAPAAEAAPAAPAPATSGVTGASALDILPSGGGLGRGRGRKRTPQAPMPTVSEIAAAAAAPDEAYVPQAFVPKGPIAPTPAQVDEGGSLSEVLRARSAMASAALSELSQLQGTPLVRRERGASEAGRFAAASQAAAQTPAPARPTRSAADVRSMLSGFQAGVTRGRSTENEGGNS